ncbi:MAG: CBS domain-containing protein, partial [Bacteroidota bacterium]
DVFLHNTFHALPVTQQGRLVGIITTQDLIRLAFKRTAPLKVVKK